MDVIIKTGFQKVTHDIIFQPETVSKGKELCKAKHVRNVQEYRKAGVSNVITADIIRQTSVTAQPYNTKLFIDANRSTCVYNQSCKCKHVAALIYYMNYEDSFTKTDVEQQWGKPSVKQFTQEKYSKGCYAYEMFVPANNVNIEPVDVNIDELHDSSALKNILVQQNKDGLKCTVKNVMKDLLKQIELMEKKRECELCVNCTFDLSVNQPIYTNTHAINQKDYHFYVKNIILNKAEVVSLCCDTINQSECLNWFKARALRISASISAHNIKTRSKKPVDKLISQMISPKKIDTFSTQYGKNTESIAISQYQETFKKRVIRVGLIVSVMQPFLCASVDGLIVENGHVCKILEIKCPSSCIIKSVCDYNLRKCNVPYLQFDNNQITLKATSSYYTQCQMQIYVTGLAQCDLFIYSPVESGSICIPVQRNEEFLKTVICKCEAFYFRDLLPKLRMKMTGEEEINNESNSHRQFSGRNIANICDD